MAVAIARKVKGHYHCYAEGADTDYFYENAQGSVLTLLFISWHSSGDVDKCRKRERTEKQDIEEEIGEYEGSVMLAHAVVEHKTMLVVLKHTPLASKTMTGFLRLFNLAVCAYLLVLVTDAS